MMTKVGKKTARPTVRPIAPVQIREITTRKDLKRFVRFPFDLYTNSPFWVPPLIKEEIREMTPGINPAFEHCEAAFFLALRNGRVLGRIAGIINHLFNQKWDKKMARFYWFDFTDDPEVPAGLLTAVERWAVAKGMKEIIGPMGFTTFERQGILIQGFDLLPTIASAYNYEYYPQHLENQGYVKEHDYLEYRITVPDTLPAKSAQVEALTAKRYRLRLINGPSKKALLKYDREVFRVINEAYRDLLGFVELTDKQITYFLKKYNSIILPGFLIGVVDEQGKLVGFQISMPSLSRAFQRARGRLFPFGFYHIYRAIKRPEIVDLLLVGVVPEYRNKGVNAFFLNDITRTCIARNIKYGESNGMLEDNFKILNFTRYYEVEQHKKRRIYAKSLDQAPS